MTGLYGAIGASPPANRWAMNRADQAVRSAGDVVAGLVVDGRPVLGHVLDRRLSRVDIAGRGGQEDTGEAARPGGVDLTVHRTVFVGQKSHQGRHQFRCHRGGQGLASGPSPPASDPPAIRVYAAGATRLTLMPWAAPAVARLRAIPITAPLAVA